MILWTMQPKEVVEILESTGEFTCDPDLADRDFRRSYKWLVHQMDLKGIEHPYGLKFPIWAWHTLDWKHEKPDLDEEMYGTPGEEMVCIEFEIDDKDVLLSDFDAWHYVLNNSFFDSSHNEEEWELQHKWFDSLAPKLRDRVMKESWQSIFDVTPYKTDWISKGQYVQAVFWKLRKDMVRSYTNFIAK